MKGKALLLNLIIKKVVIGKYMKKFSLMELLVVMGILLLMMSLLLPTVAPMLDRAELNKVVTTIIGQLDIGYAKSLEKSQVTRVSFNYDPKGKNLTRSDLSTMSKVPVLTSADEFVAMQSKDMDLNNDGVPAGYVGRQFFWLKLYLCTDRNTFTKKSAIEALPVPSNNVIGPFWFRRPISRVKNVGGVFQPTKMYLNPIELEDGQVYYYRPHSNKGSYLGEEHLMPINGDGSFNLISDTGATINYSLTESEIQSYSGGCETTYFDSVALYSSANGIPFPFNYGKTIDTFYKSLPKPEDREYQISTKWFDVLEGDNVDPNTVEYGLNEDEDGIIDEGMSVSVETYNQSELSPKVRLPVALGKANEIKSYNGYFSAIPDNYLKIGREFYIGGKDRKGVMLRRVWGVLPGKSQLVLLWSYNEIIRPAPPFTKITLSTPFSFYIVFDQKNGFSGMSFGNSYGSEQVGKLFFQVCDDDNRLSSIVEFSDGSSKEGSLEDLGLTKSDLVGYYQGTK